MFSLEIKTRKTKQAVFSNCHQNTEQSHNKVIGNKHFEYGKFRITVRNQNCV